MLDIATIKLVIWDLDDTLWTGTLSEGGVFLPEEHRQLIVDLTEVGIINSICSKNDLELTKQELMRLGIWDYFVFASINWENKGARLKYTIEQMSLRPTNVLFIDDNTFNLQEAKHYLPDLQVAMPDIVPDIIEHVKKLSKKDINQKRLKQYKLLEEKAIAATKYDTNEAFLYASNIRVQINKNCIPVADRIHELILRTNQLNYTKNRISFEELHAMLNDNQYDCGYVMVNDKYGDYGIVGFYANRGGEIGTFPILMQNYGANDRAIRLCENRLPKIRSGGGGENSIKHP